MTDLSSGYHRLMVVTRLPSIVYQTHTAVTLIRLNYRMLDLKTRAESIYQ